MIKLTRIRTEQAIPSGLRGANRVKKNLQVLELKRELGDIPSKEFKSNLWKPAKNQLRRESNDKCAYCEADTKVVAHGDVEHFRPKNVYWWMAYCYDNYLYSCQICNQTFKSNLFPRSGPKLKSVRVGSRTSDARLKALAESLTHDPLDQDGVAAYVKTVTKEKADLIDPYVFDPEEFLVWEADDVKRQVRVRVKPRVAHRAEKQEAIDDVYGLNREELLNIRYQDYSLALTLSESLTALTDALGEDAPVVKRVESELRDMMADKHRFAGMLRYFANQEWELDLG